MTSGLVVVDFLCIILHFGSMSEVGMPVTCYIQEDNMIAIL